MYNVTLKCLEATIVVVGKQYVFLTLSVSL